MPERKKIPWWLWPNILSLDAPVVAIVWLAAFSKAFQVPLAPVVYAVLFACVWCIYTGDRLFDTGRGTLKTPRHRFVRQNRKPFAAIFSLVAALALWLSLSRLDPGIFRIGIAVALAALGYFGVFVWQKYRGKEFAAGIIFALGASFPVWLSIDPFQVESAAAIALFAAICVLNCFLIEWKESGMHSRARAAKVLPTAVIAVSIGCATAFPLTRRLFVSLTMAGLALALLHRFGGRLSENAFRVLVDAALLTPLAWLPFSPED